MNISKKITLMLFLTGILLLSGCDGGEQEQETTASPYIGGTQGLEAEFEPIGIEEEGRYNIYEGDTFPLQILLKNKGEYDIEPGDVTVKIQGIPLSDFAGIASGEMQNEKEIEGVSELNERGGERIIDFGQNIKYIEDVPGTFYDLNIFASYIYRYKTYASAPNICFKEDLRDERICDVEESKEFHCSGAPIQIVSVEEKSAGRGIIEVDFEVENVGSGKSTLPGEDFSPQYNQIAFAIEPVSERNKWRCTAAARTNEARLIDGKATIRCKLKEPLEEDALYTKAIGLTLSYDYRDIIKEKLRIEKEI